MYKFLLFSSNAMTFGTVAYTGLWGVEFVGRGEVFWKSN